MGNGLLLITHGTIGASLLREVEIMLGPLPLPYALIEIDPDDEVIEITARAAHAVRRLREQCDRILLLTDLYGATPSNVGHQLEHIDAIVHGVNLPMLIKAANYRTLSLEQLLEKVLVGGKESIFSGPSPQ